MMIQQPDPLHVDFHLLDRQIVDRDGALVGKVDDVELATGDEEAIRVVALLVGQQALGRRIGGRLGGWMARAARRLSRAEDPRPLRIPYELVREVSSEVTLGVRRDALAEPALEAWLRQHLIDRIPGAGDAG